MMTDYGLIGYPLDHSFSAEYFNARFEKEKTDAVFHLFPIEYISLLPSLLSNHPELKGLAVTVPYKEVVIPYLDLIDTTAKEVGAVNCIKTGKKLIGFNTDIIGFEHSLKPLLQSHHTAALVLGTGGGSKAVQFVLRRLGITFTLVSTTDPLALHYKEVNEETIKNHPVIINCTPLGMFPLVNTMPPIPYSFISDQHLLFDLVYNPEVSAFLQEGKIRNATIKNGYEMLLIQAEENWRIWNEN